MRIEGWLVIHQESYGTHQVLIKVEVQQVHDATNKRNHLVILPQTTLTIISKNKSDIIDFLNKKMILNKKFI